MLITSRYKYILVNTVSYIFGIGKTKMMYDMTLYDKNENCMFNSLLFQYSNHPNIARYFGAFIKKIRTAEDQLWVSSLKFHPFNHVLPLAKFKTVLNSKLQIYHK